MVELTDKILSDNEIESIRAGDPTFLRELYQTYRNGFTNWLIKNHRCDEEDAKEIYQQAFTILYFNIKDEKITNLQSQLKTYLYGIGQNVFLKQRRKQARYQLLVQDEGHPDIENINYYENDNEERVQRMRRGMEQLGEPCKSILMMVFFQNFSMESVANRMGYKSEGVARKKKFFCLQHLRKIIAEF